MEPRSMSRRQLLIAGGTLTGGAVLALTPGTAGAQPTLARPVSRRTFANLSGNRPTITHGVQSGDVVADRAVIWSRTDRPARMWVEVSRTDSFRDAEVVRGPIATAATDFTAQVRVTDLPRGERVFYRVHFADLDRGLESEPMMGSFASAPRGRQSLRFVWTGDCAGQGWGINPDLGGMTCWETMRRANPDFLLFSGDTVYADGPLLPQVTLADGSIWRNIVTPEKSKVAETLDEFRGQWKYNLMDENVRRFNAEVPVIVQWDDHEVTNNWYPGETLTNTGGDARYTVKDVNTLVARSAQAFHEYFPMGPTAERTGRVYRQVSYGPLLDVFVIDMRTFRGPNTANKQTAPGADTAFLGTEQIDWLLRGLERSKATWKVIAADMPIGLQVPDGPAWEAVANGDNGAPLGRELEMAHLLSEMKRRKIGDVVWLTADVHYAAAHHYHPDRAQFKDFDPFWEFVSGPVHAGTFGPNLLDTTFGIEVAYQKAALFPNMPPSAGYQFFGVVDIESKGDMVVRLVDTAGTELFSQRLEPSRRR